jgi:outer membrane protein TolC
VIQIEAQKEVARNFYEVGMTPLNDFLQADVALANARQELVIAENNLATAKSNFNILLRRPINAPVIIEDILDYKTFEQDLEYCFKTAQNNRLEFIVADKDIEIAEKEVQLARKNYYPTVNLEGNYYRRGDNPEVTGGRGIFDPDGWTVTATASWDFWEWGRSYYSIKEQLNRLNQAQYRKEDLQDTISFEVKQAYQKIRETEKNINTVERAIVQAQENFRINQERFKEQVATSTDVLDAQTLLSRTRTNYYNALYDFKISKAALYRAMGLEVLE